MNYDDPAARLHALLQEGRKIPLTDPCKSAWERLLDAEGKPSLLMSRLGKVMEMPELVIKAVQEVFPNHGNNWGHWSGQVNLGFQQQNLSSDWRSFISAIDDHTITYLKMTSDMLATKANTELVPGASLAAIKADLSLILEEVLESDQPDEVKKYLARSIGKIISSIDEYRLTGALPLLDAIDSSIGHIALDVSYRNFLVDTEIGQRLMDALTAMANVVTVSVGLPPLSAAIARIAG